MLNLSRKNGIHFQHVVKKVMLLLIVLCSDLQSPGLAILVCLITTDKAPSISIPCLNSSSCQPRPRIQFLVIEVSEKLGCASVQTTITCLSWGGSRSGPDSFSKGYDEHCVMVPLFPLKNPFLLYSFYRFLHTSFCYLACLNLLFLSRQVLCY